MSAQVPYQGEVSSYEPDEFTFSAFAENVAVTPVLEFKMLRNENGELSLAGAELLLKEQATGKSCGEYIEQAEADGSVGPVVRHTLEIAKKAIDSMLDAGVHVQIAVNVPLQELRTETFDLLVEIVERYPEVVPLLELEITEREPMEKDHVTSLAELQLLGYEITLDDFDTAKINLQTFDEFPGLWSIVSKVKIDKNPLTTDPTEFDAMLDTLEKHGLTIVREGVEHNDHHKTIPDHHHTQGYVHGPPQRLSDFVNEVRRVE